MPLTAGSKLGNFEILGSLGAGGMGEVFRARDHSLGRDVAIKVLPDSLAGDPDRRSRFGREARLLAAVNHPGLASIYGMEESDGRQFIVMELVPGATLADMLAAGPLAPKEAFSIAAQIAEGLEAAHSSGIVHRDLKPANVKVTPEGRVKILDLGLAKAFDTAADREDISKSPTMPLGTTKPGVILGTAEYMSPEQARGKTLDKRTDIWSFGCIVYEMLSGRRAFTGDTSSDIIAAILTGEPDWSRLPASTPASIRELLSRCLAKDLGSRLRDIGDARLEIGRVIGTASSSGVPSKPPRAIPAPAIIAAVVAAALGAAAAWIIVRRPPDRAASADVGKQYLAVLPFRDLSGSPGAELLGEGLAETVSVRLAATPGMRVVVPSASTAAAEHEDDPLRAGRGLGASLVLRGAVQRSGSEIRITYVVLRVGDGVQLASGDVTGPASALFDLQDRLSDRVTSELKLAGPARPNSTASGLTTASQQGRFFEALGDLQRYDRYPSVDAAVRILEGLSADAPASGLVAATLARAYLDKFDIVREPSWLDRAKEALDRASRLGADPADMSLASGELALRTGRVPEAVPAFERVLALRPNDYAATIGLASALAKSGRAAEAEQTFERAIRLQPAVWIGYSAFAGYRARRGEYAKAAALFRRVTELTPDSALAFSNLGGMETLLGDFPAAEASYQKSLAIEPTDLAYSNLGTARFYRGDFSGAADCFEKAVAKTPGRYDLWTNLGDARRWLPSGRLAANEAYAKGIALARDALKVNPRDVEACSSLSVGLAKTGQPAEAENLARRALDLAPKNPEILYNAGIVFSLVSKRSEAVDCLAKAVRAGYPAAFLASDPELLNLRDDERLKKVVAGSPGPGRD